MKVRIKKLLRDIPTSLLVIIGIILLLFAVSNVVSLVKALITEANILKKNDYEVSYSMYVYEGEETSEDNEVDSSDLIKNPEKLIDCLRVSKGNVTAQLFLNLDGESLISDILLYQNEDLYTQGEVFKPATEENAMLISEDLSYLITKNNTVECISNKFNVISRLKSNDITDSDTRCIVFYNTLNSSAKKHVHTQMITDSRILITISSNESRLTNEIEKVKKALTDNGFTITEDVVEIMNITNIVYKQASKLIAGLIIAFAIITIIIIMNLWFYTRQKNYAIQWALGRSKLSTLMGILKEVGTLYLISVIIYCIAEAVFKLTIGTQTLTLKEFIINDVMYISITYVILNVVITIQYLDMVIKSNMCNLLTGGVQ